MTSVFQQHTTWSPEPTPHVIPGTDITCCPQNFYRVWTPKMTSRVFARNAIVMWSPQLPSHVGHRIAIVLGPQNCHRIWSTELTLCLPHHCYYMWDQNCHHMVPRTTIFMRYPELTSVCGPHKCHRTCSPELTSLCGPHNFHHMWSPELTSLCGPHNFHYMCSPELTSLCGPHNFHHMWSPNLPSHGPQNCHPHVVPTTAILMWSPLLTLPVISRTDLKEVRVTTITVYDGKEPSVTLSVESYGLYETAPNIKKVVSISTSFFGKHGKLFNTCRKVNSSPYRP